MSKEWVEEIRAMNDEELIKDIEGRRDSMFFKDLWITEMLIRILRKFSKEEKKEPTEKVYEKYLP